MAPTKSSSSASGGEIFGSEAQISYKDFAKAYRVKLSEESSELNGKQKSKAISKAWKHSPQNPKATIGDEPAKKSRKGAESKKVEVEVEEEEGDEE